MGPRPSSPNSTAPLPSAVPEAFKQPQHAAPPQMSQAESQHARPEVHLVCHKMSQATDRIMFTMFRPSGVSNFLQSCVTQVLTILYPHDLDRPKAVRAITFFLDHMDGVAHTHSSHQADHKEIHLSISYFARQPPERLHAELEGVLVHEIVHCYQYDAHGSAPGGFIEGMADLVRLYNNHAPPHWNPREKGDRWDAGYQNTAFFFAWIDRTHPQLGNGQVTILLNEACRSGKWSDSIFVDITGETIERLWEKYINHA